MWAAIQSLWLWYCVGGFWLAGRSIRPSVLPMILHRFMEDLIGCINITLHLCLYIYVYEVYMSLFWFQIFFSQKRKQERFTDQMHTEELWKQSQNSITHFQWPWASAAGTYAVVDYKIPICKNTLQVNVHQAAAYFPKTNHHNCHLYWCCWGYNWLQYQYLIFNS